MGFNARRKIINKLNYFELAGYTKEESEELIRICNECGVSYDVVASALSSFKEVKNVEKAIREFNSKSYFA